MAVPLRRILKDFLMDCFVRRILRGLSIEKNFRGCHVGKNISSCGGENDSERLPCQKDSEGFCGVRNLTGCCI